MPKYNKIATPESQATDREIERRWLVDPSLVSILQGYAVQSEKIKQGYGRDEEGKFRLRKSTTIGDQGEKQTRYYETRKQRLNAAERVEIERELSEDEFEDRWPDTKGWRIKKERFHIPYDKNPDGSANHMLELDVFPSMPHLVAAEIECGSVEEAANLPLEPWLGPEITGVKGWGNSHLAEEPKTPEDVQELFAEEAQHHELLDA